MLSGLHRSVWTRGLPIHGGIIRQIAIAIGINIKLRRLAAWRIENHRDLGFARCQMEIHHPIQRRSQIGRGLGNLCRHVRRKGQLLRQVIAELFRRSLGNGLQMHRLLAKGPDGEGNRARRNQRDGTPIRSIGSSGLQLVKQFSLATYGVGRQPSHRRLPPHILAAGRALVQTRSNSAAGSPCFRAA